MWNTLSLNANGGNQGADPRMQKRYLIETAKCAEGFDLGALGGESWGWTGGKENYDSTHITAGSLLSCLAAYIQCIIK